MSTRNGLFLIGIFALAVFLSACNANPQPAGLTPIPSLAPAPTLTLVPAIQGSALTVPSAGGVAGKPDGAAGAPVFYKNCTSCHGAQGEGGVGLPLRNDAFISKGDDSAIIDTITNGRPGTAMPAWFIDQGGPLNVVQIQNVVAFLHTLQNVPVIPKPTPAPEEKQEPSPTPGPTPEPARPSNTGDMGQAVSLTGSADRGKPLFGQYCAACHGPQGVLGVPNPGTEDGSVPVLNPIDETIANPDAKTFAKNVDLFIEHGSIPDGDNPSLIMPNFGDGKMLTAQNIADLIAYIIQLNTQK